MMAPGTSSGAKTWSSPGYGCSHPCVSYQLRWFNCEGFDESALASGPVSFCLPFQSSHLFAICCLSAGTTVDGTGAAAGFAGAGWSAPQEGSVLMPAVNEVR